MWMSGRHRGGRPVVSALRPVLPERGAAASRAGRRGRPRDGLRHRRLRVPAARRPGVAPAEVVTDKAGVYPRVLDELVPAALSTAQIRSGQPAAYDTSRSTWEV